MSPPSSMSAPFASSDPRSRLERKMTSDDFFPFEVRRISLRDDQPFLHDIPARGKGQGEAKILLDQHDRVLARRANLQQHVPELLDDRGSQTLGGLVEEEELWACDQDTGDGQH